MPPNTVLAVAYDLKVFVTAVRKTAEAVTTADLLPFMTAPRPGARAVCTCHARRRLGYRRERPAGIATQKVSCF